MTLLGRPKGVSCSLFFCFVFVAVAFADAQTVTGTLSNVTRAESWSYFQPIVPPGPDNPIGDPDYTFFGDRAELGVTVEGSRFDLAGAFNYVRVENLPADAIGPGGLGTGAFYYAASGVPYSYQLYLSGLSVRIKSSDRRSSITLGRMPFSSGGEFTSSSPTLERVKRERLQSRLIGNFEWSYYQRRFDGARLDLDRSTWHVTAAAFVPTQGGFEESSNLSMPKVQLFGGALTHKRSTAEWQAFAYGYRDRRPNTAVIDNTGATDRPADVTIGTFGGSYASVIESAHGEFDVVAWTAAQLGGWYGRSQRAGSIALEGGHRWLHATLSPWLRAGYLWASGDGNPEDGTHGTFFQMLPSSRQYALSSVYAQMNLRDLFAQLALEPSRVKARIEIHKVDVASGADLWYQGSGATSSHDRYFGFSGRYAGESTTLGTIVEGSVDVPIIAHWSVNGYAAVMSAGDVPKHYFTDKRLTFWSIENVIRF